MLMSDALDQNPHSDARRLSVSPFRGWFAPQAVQQCMGDDAKIVVPRHGDRAIILGKGVMTNDFFLPESFHLSDLVCGPDVLAETNQFPHDLRRGDGIAMVAGDRFP